MSPEQWQYLGFFASLFKWYNGKRSTTASLPVDGEVFGVDFDQVGVPSVVADADVVVALFLLRRPAEDVPCEVVSVSVEGLEKTGKGIEGVAYDTSTLERSGRTLEMDGEGGLMRRSSGPKLYGELQAGRVWRELRRRL